MYAPPGSRGWGKPMPKTEPERDDPGNVNQILGDPASRGGGKGYTISGFPGSYPSSRPAPKPGSSSDRPRGSNPSWAGNQRTKPGPVRTRKI